MTRRTKRRKRARKRLMFTVFVVVLALIAIATMIGKAGQQEASASVKECIITEEKTTDKYDVFDTVSIEKGEEYEGFVYYEIPPEYEENDGYFPEVMQAYTYTLCKQEGVSYPLIVAMIERESGYQFDAVGDDGKSFGYMQINETANAVRIAECGCADMLNPYQNVTVGIRLMKELIEKYGTIQDALTAYNYGERGAREKMWNNGIYVYEYNEGIMNRMREIEEEL